MPALGRSPPLPARERFHVGKREKKRGWRERKKERGRGREGGGRRRKGGGKEGSVIGAWEPSIPRIKERKEGNAIG